MGAVEVKRRRPGVASSPSGARTGSVDPVGGTIATTEHAGAHEPLSQPSKAMARGTATNATRHNVTSSLVTITASVSRPRSVAATRLAAGRGT